MLPKISKLVWQILAIVTAASTQHHNLTAETTLWDAHQSDAVDWKEWVPDTVGATPESDLPFFFFVSHFGNSLGRAMLTETFQNETIANQLNETAIPILLDVHENPELTSLLRRLASEHFDANDLPINIWTDQKLRPLTGGGYFPPTDDWGSQGFLTVSRNVAEQWLAKDEGLLNSAKSRFESSTTKAREEELAELKPTYPNSTFSPSEAPRLNAIDFYTYAQSLESSDSSLSSNTVETLENSLSEILLSATFDSIAGGFITGANDPNWNLPSFHKSTTDQALMLFALARLQENAGSQIYSDAIRLTFSFVEEELLKENGLCIHFIDSLALGESPSETEGKYYLITPDDLQTIPQEAHSIWSLADNGNLDEDTDILGLYRQLNVPRITDSTALSSDFDHFRKTIKTLRSSKTRPAVVETGYTSTNALLALSLLEAGKVLGDGIMVDRSKSILGSILENNYSEANSALHNSDELQTLASSLDITLLTSALLAFHEYETHPQFLEAAMQLYTHWLNDPRFDSENPIDKLTGIDGIQASYFEDREFPSAVGFHLRNLEKLKELSNFETSISLIESAKSSLPSSLMRNPENYRSLIYQLNATRK